jgi:hypothetical protein
MQIIIQLIQLINSIKRGSRYSLGIYALILTPLNMIKAKTVPRGSCVLEIFNVQLVSIIKADRRKLIKRRSLLHHPHSYQSSSPTIPLQPAFPNRHPSPPQWSVSLPPRQPAHIHHHRRVHDLPNHTSTTSGHQNPQTPNPNPKLHGGMEWLSGWMRMQSWSHIRREAERKVRQGRRMALDGASRVTIN